MNIPAQDTGIHLTNKLSDLYGSLFLLLAPLWRCEHHSPYAKLTVESVPPRISEGESVLLLVHGLPRNLLSLFWYKGVFAVKKFEIAKHIKATNSSVPGPAHSGRETVYSNGSLLLHQVTQNDTGFYTLRTMSTDLKDEVARVQLQLGSKWFSVVVQCRLGL